MLSKCKFNPFIRIKLIMTNNFPPNTDPNIFALTAVAIAAAITGDFNSYELNSIGNWLELIGQYLLCAGSQQQLIESRTSDIKQKIDIDYIHTAIKRIESELEKIKKEI